MKLRHNLTILLLSMVLMACSSTTQTGFWRNPDYTEKIHKIYIVGVARLDINRFQFEDVFSDELQARGAVAIPSYKDGNFPVSLDEQTIVDRAFSNGADSVLVAKALGEYGRRYEVDYQPATTTEYRVVTLEVVIYETKTGKAIWSGQFETVMDRRYEFLFSDFAKAVAKDLAHNGLL